MSLVCFHVSMHFCGGHLSNDQLDSRQPSVKRCATSAAAFGLQVLAVLDASNQWIKLQWLSLKIGDPQFQWVVIIFSIQMVVWGYPLQVFSPIFRLRPSIFILLHPAMASQSKKAYKETNCHKRVMTSP